MYDIVHSYGIHLQRGCDWQHFVVVCRYYVIVIDDCFSVDHRRQSPRIITGHSTCRYANYYCATPCLVRSLLSSGVCLSVRSCHVYCIQTAEDVVKLLFRPGSPIILVFWPPAPIPNSKGNPFVWGVKYTGGGENLRFSTEIAVYLRIGLDAHCCHGTLIGNRRLRIDPCRFRCLWVTLKGGSS